MNLQYVKEGDVIIINQEGHEPWAERVVKASPCRLTTRPQQNYDISSDCVYEKGTGKGIGFHYGEPIARIPTPEDELAILRLEMSEMDEYTWKDVPLEKLRKIREILG